MSNETKNTHIAKKRDKMFKIVELCREHNINAKIARRRMRVAIQRNDERVIECVERDNVRDDMRVKHEFVDNAKNRKLILSIIQND